MSNLTRVILELGVKQLSFEICLLGHLTLKSYYLLFSCLNDQQVSPSQSTMLNKSVASSLFLEWCVQLRLLNVCQVEWDWVQIYLPASPPHRACPVTSSIAAARHHSGWKAAHVWPWGMMGDGKETWVWRQGGMPMTYSRFRSYSCGNTVIISPLLLNSVIVSYISRARGQEIFRVYK